MRNDVGIFNSKSYTNEYLRELRRKPFTQRVRTTVTRGDLESLALWVTSRYNLALYHGSEVCVREHERQLSLLAQYADQMAEAGLP